VEKASPARVNGDAPPGVLSIVIPAYNEERFIGTLLDRLLRVDLTPFGLTREVIVVDDHSADRTAAIAEAVPGVRLERLPANGGKGQAVRAGMRLATGDYVLIQDADLEYDPQDHLILIGAARRYPGAVIYGSRYLEEGRRPGQYLLAYAGGRALSLLASVCTGVRLTDTSTALKLLPRSVLQSVELTSTGFEIDQEITVKLLARGVPIREMPVRYAPRTRDEGKKIGWRDWLMGACTLIRFRKG